MSKIFDDILRKVISEDFQQTPPVASVMDEDDEDLEGDESKAKQADKNTPPVGEESPADTAHKLGLTYKGYAKWKDKSGDTVAKTIGDKLVKLDKDTEEPKNALNPGSLDTPVAYDKDTQQPQLKAQPPQLATATNIKVDPSIVGHINPPKNNNNEPIEVTVKGKPGMIDAFNPDHDSVIVTFDDGSSDEFRKSEVKPKVPDDIKQMASTAAKTARGNHEGNHAMKLFGDSLKGFLAEPDTDDAAKKYADDMTKELLSSGLNTDVIHKLMQGIIEKMPKGPDKNKLSKLYWAIGQQTKPSLDKMKQSDMFPNLPPEPEPGLKTAKKSKETPKVDKSRFDQSGTMKIPAHTSIKKMDVDDFAKRLTQLHPEMRPEQRAKIVDLFRDYQGGTSDGSKFDDKLRRPHKGSWDLK